jgi:cytochrome c-type biogenesis protein CcmH
MIWLAAALLALCALAPAGLALRRHIRVRGRTQASMDLHRAQLVELERDLAERRISASDHATAVLEVQRRLLSASEAADATPRVAARSPLVAGLVLVPLAALGLYLIGGRPNLPSQPLAARMTAADKRLADETAMAQQLREALATVDPHSDKARQGEMLLGNLEASRGDYAAAAQAWRKALTLQFDPLLAARVADATSRAEGRISEASAALFRQALAAAPPDAPWRSEIEQRLSEAQAQ